MRVSKPNYLAKVQQLSEEEQERLLSRMTGKLPRRLVKEKLSRDEALAIQMELEDEQLQEWRAKMHALKAEDGKLAKAKAAGKQNIEAKPKAQAKPSSTKKQKPSA